MTSLALPAVVLAMVAVDLPTDVGRSARERIIDGCQGVLGAGQCTLSSDDSRAAWHARVSLDELRLVVTLTRSDAPDAEVARREIVFSEDDGEEQRFFAAGLIVAALTAQQSKAAQQSEPPLRDAHAEDAAVAGDATASTLGAIDGGGLVGRGLSASDYKIGGVARGSLLFRQVPIDATASVHFASSFGEPAARWWGGSIGVAARFTEVSARLSLALRAEVLLEQAQARATRDGSEERVTSSWRGGGQLGPVVAYRVARWVVPWVAGEVSVIRPELVVRVADQTVGSEGEVRWAFSLGGRFYLGE